MKRLRRMGQRGLQNTSLTYLTIPGCLAGVAAAVRNACPAVDAPWLPRPTRFRIACSLLIWALALPLFVAAIACDALYSLLPASPLNSNALRVIATRTGN